VGGRMAEMGASVYGDTIKEAGKLQDWDLESKTFSEINQDLESAPPAEAKETAAPVEENPPRAVTGQQGPAISTGQPVAREETYWKGDRAEYTGKSDEIAGGTFYELELMEGHRKGEKVWTSHAPQTEEKPAAEERETPAPEVKPEEKAPEPEPAKPVRSAKGEETTLKIPRSDTDY